MLALEMLGRIQQENHLAHTFLWWEILISLNLSMNGPKGSFICVPLKLFPAKDLPGQGLQSGSGRPPHYVGADLCGLVLVSWVPHWGEAWLG